VRVTPATTSNEAPAVPAGAQIMIPATRPTGPASRVHSAGLRPPLTPAHRHLGPIDPQKPEESPKMTENL